MIDLVIARALHVLAVVHWIGGVSLVTLAILPGLRDYDRADARLALFERIEGRFSGQARVSVSVAGASGFYLTWRMDLWARFTEPGYWWMHAMVALWLLFTGVLFIAEPLFLHAWVRRRHARAPATTFALVEHAHRIALAASAVTVLAAVLGAHGLLY
ncbi:MAG: hypothetical protein RLW62_18350 [Gammaproteobacteria bacterium]